MSRRWERQSPRTKIALVSLGLMAVYLVIAASFPTLVFWSNDSDLKFLQLQNLRWEGGPRIDLRLAGRALDPAMHALPLGEAFYEVREGRVFLVWSVVFPLLSLPFYRLLGPIGLFVIPAACGAGTAYATGRLAEALRPRSGPTAAALLGLSTPVLVYSASFWEHSLALFASTWGLYAVVAGTSRGVRLFGGIALGFAAGTLRADLYPLLVGLLLATLLVDRARLPSVLVGIGLASLPSWALNLALNGHALPLNAAKNFSRFTGAYLSEAKLAVLPDFLAGRGPDLDFPAVFAVATLIAVVLLRVRGRVRDGWVSASLVAVALLAVAVVRALVLAEPAPAPLHGFLAVSPLLVVAVAFRAETCAAPPTGRYLAWIAALYTGAYLVAICVATPLGPAGGYLEWGPRFFLPIFPIGVVLAVVAAEAMVRHARGAGRSSLLAALGLLALVGVLHEAVGVRQLVAHARRKDDMRARVAAARGPVFADVWWALPASAMRPEGKPMFYAWAYEPFRDVLLAARNQGADEMAVLSYYPFAHNPFFDRARAEGLSVELASAEKSSLGLWVTRVRIAAPRPISAP